MDIPGTLAVIAQAISITKDLKDIDRGIDSAEFKLKIAELSSSLADAKLTLLDAQEELQGYEKEIRQLKDAFAFRGKLVEYHGLKYESFEDGGPKGNPFCPRCEQNSGRFYRLNEIRKDGIRWICPECKTDYGHVPAFLWEKQS